MNPLERIRSWGLSPLTEEIVEIVFLAVYALYVLVAAPFALAAGLMGRLIWKVMES